MTLNDKDDGFTKETLKYPCNFFLKPSLPNDMFSQEDMMLDNPVISQRHRYRVEPPPFHHNL